MNFGACFFCGKDITKRKSREHIFSNKFLKYLDLKLEKVTSSLSKPTPYSKVKVAAHAECNNEIGSEIEKQILSLIKSMDSNLDILSNIHAPSENLLSQNVREVFILWLAKLYYGMLYWECSLQKHANPKYQKWLAELLSGPEFAYLRRCFVEKIRFRIPSSLYHFQVPDPPDHAFRFDFGDSLPHGLFFIRFRNHLLVTALADGFLVREWFTEKHVANFQEEISKRYTEDPAIYLNAVANIWAVRELLPIQPMLEYHESEIRDRSRVNLPKKIEIDSSAVNDRARSIFNKLVSRWKRSFEG